MSIHAGPKVVADSVSFSVDASHAVSYAKTGTTIVNTANMTSTSLAGGFTYTSDNGGIFNFNGSTGYGDTGIDLSWNNTNSATVMFVCKTGNVSQNAQIVGKGTDWEWGFRQGQQAASDGSLTFIYWDTSGGSTNGPIMTVSNVFALNTWVHICGVWSHSANTMTLYVNGKSAKANSWTNASINSNKTNTVKFGGSGYGWGGTGYWNGAIASLKLFNRALTVDEVHQSFIAVRGRFGI